MDSTLPKRHQLLSPKLDFLRPEGVPVGQPTKAGQFQDIAASPSFKEAVQCALVEFVVRQKPANSVEATVCGIETQGAKAVLNILLNLGVDDVPMTSRASMPQLTKT